MPKDTLLLNGKRLCEKHQSQQELRWQAIDQVAARYKKHLRPLYMAVEFSSTAADSCWLRALRWMKEVFSKQQKLTQRPLEECPADTIPNRLRPHLLITDQNVNAAGLRVDRYEFWIYRQIRKRLNSGEVYLEDSLAHRCFSDELVSLDEKADVLRQLDIPWLRRPIDDVLDSLFAELHQLWGVFDRDLRHGRLKHPEYNSAHKTLSWHKAKIDTQEAVQTGFYSKLQARDIAEIFRFVNQQCGLGQDTLDHQGVDVDKADLQQVKRQHSELLVLQVVGSDLTAFAVEDEAVGSVPCLDDVEAFLDFAAQRFGV